MDRSEKFWDRIADMYAKQPISDEAAYQDMLHKIKHVLNSDNMMIDYGCGTGTMSIDLSNHVSEIHAIDISAKMLEIAGQRLEDKNIKNIKLSKTTIFDANFLACSYDVVLAFNILHFIDDIESVLIRINQLLKPGGYFITETPCIGEHKRFANKLVYLPGKTGLIPKLNLLTFESFENSIVKSGFEIIEKNNLSKTPRDYLVFARKLQT